MNKIKLKMGFLTFFMLFVIISTGTKEMFLSIITAIIHELGHIFASKCLHIDLCELNLSFLGARLKTVGGTYSYKKEIILCLFGPLFNFLSIIIFVLLRRNNEEIFDILIVYSLALGILNLLPIKTFDGGRILESSLLIFLSPVTVRHIVEFLSFISIFILWCVSVYILLIYKTSLGLFVFSVSIFCQHFVSQYD